MTCILSLPFERGALLASDTRSMRVTDGVVVGVHRASKLARDPCKPRWLVGSNPCELGDELVSHLIAGGAAEKLPAMVDRWVVVQGLGASLSTARLSEMERTMLGSPMHVIELGEDGAFYATGINPLKGTTTTFAARDRGFWFSYPYGADEAACGSYLVAFTDEWRTARARYGGTSAELTHTLRAIAHLFTTLEARYGGPEGWMDDQIEVGALWRVATGSVVILHLRPTRAARLMAATDEEIFTDLETDEALPAGPLLDALPATPPPALVRDPEGRPT